MIGILNQESEVKTVSLQEADGHQLGFLKTVRNRQQVRSQCGVQEQINFKELESGSCESNQDQEARIRRYKSGKGLDRSKPKVKNMGLEGNSWAIRPSPWCCHTTIN